MDKKSTPEITKKTIEIHPEKVKKTATKNSRKIIEKTPENHQKTRSEKRDIKNLEK